MIPALAVVKLARIEVVRKWDYRHFGAQCLLVAQGCTDPAAPYRPLTGEHRPRIFAQRRSSARPSLTRSRHRLCIAAIEATLACCGVSERSGSLSGPCLGPLFDHLVGAREDNRRNGKAERIRAALVPDPVCPASAKMLQPQSSNEPA